MIRRKHRGQALIMLTLALLAMCGIIGLAVDLGWSFYVQKSAQKAADAAALAAAQAVLNTLGRAGGYDCTNPALSCLATPTPCTVGNTYLDQACQVAAANGFSVGTSPPQNVTIASGTGTPPTAPGVGSYYWVTVRATQQIPQLFSAVFGNGTATVSARATAAVVDSITVGSLWLLNRDGDDMPTFGPPGADLVGVNLKADGGPTIHADGGIFMASACDGSCGPKGRYAAETANNTTITDPYAWFRDTGWHTGTPSWDVPPTNNMPDGPNFMDPTGGANGIPQPPLPAGITAADTSPIPGGAINGDCASPTVINKRQIYASEPLTPKIIQAPITISGCVNFTGGGIIWGGIVAKGATITFGEGTYVFAGAFPEGPQRAGAAFSIQGSSTVIIRDTHSLGASTGGEFFIFTDQYYKDNSGTSRLAAITDPQLASSPFFGSLKQGQAGFQTGAASDPTKIFIDLCGLGKCGLPVSNTLKDYDSFLMWMDRRNSYVDYNVDNGNIVCGNSNTSCPNPDLAGDGVYEDSTQLYFQASPTTSVSGAIYQPRGSWTTLQGGGGYRGALQIVTGALQVVGNPEVTLLPFNNSIRRRTVALVE